MSGSAALASARRRRTGPNQSSLSKPENVIVEEPAKMVPINPSALLLKHNQLLNILQGDFESLKTQLNSINVESESNNPNHLDFYKSQYSSLLEEMKDIKKTLIKVQTFSMETNIELMKLKRLLQKDNESVVQKDEPVLVPELTIKIE